MDALWSGLGPVRGRYRLQDVLHGTTGCTLERRLRDEGWLCVVAIKPMAEVLSGSVLAWLVAGGVFYTAGTAFYHNRRVPYSHAIWHMFVMAGTACHYLAVFQHVLRPGG